MPEALNQEFNVGAEKPWSLNELVKETAEAMGVPNHPVKKLDARFEVQNAEATHSKLKCYFDPGRVVPLSKGLKATADWVKARTQGGKKGFKPVEFDAVEVTQKMPPSWKRPSLLQSARIEHTAANNTNNQA